MYQDILKEKLKKFFRSFGFQQASIFIDVCEIVFKKGSFYIFVQFYQDTFTSKNVDEIEHRLSNLDFETSNQYCIVVADRIEENLMKRLENCDILHLTLNEIFVDDLLRNRLYSVIAQ